MSADSNCIFCKIATGRLPSNRLYEDDEFLAFHDLHPKAQVHFMIIPKLHVASLLEVDASHAPMLGRMMALVPVLARQEGLERGFKTLFNTGPDGGQEVYHLHVHVMAGPWRHG